MTVVDYELLRTNNWKLQSPEPEQEEEQDVQHPVVMDFLYNTHTEATKPPRDGERVR